MRILTWNINSLRLRLPSLNRLIHEINPDVICLQETKVTDDLFPVEFCHQVGYPHLAFCGEKSYNGVAIISKLPLKDINMLKFAGRDSCRHVSAVVEGDLEIHNFYVPSGGDEVDISMNQNFMYKLNYLDDMINWLQANRNKKDKMIMLGDLNIAPGEHDVWSHKQLLKVISHTPIEIEKIALLKQTVDWCDVSRHFISDEHKLYSWWSYRSRDWKVHNKGRRLDHIWVTQPLVPFLQSTSILKEARGWHSPSDHVPVIVDL